MSAAGLPSVLVRLVACLVASRLAASVLEASRLAASVLVACLVACLVASLAVSVLVASVLAHPASSLAHPEVDQGAGVEEYLRQARQVLGGHQEQVQDRLSVLSASIQEAPHAGVLH